MIESLTGLRALAAWWVVLFHLRVSVLAELFPAQRGRFEAVLGAGYAGVDVFFVLSGFIIAYTYSDTVRPGAPRGYVRFLWLRLARMYPVHLFTLVMLAAMVFLADRAGVELSGANDFSGGAFVANVALVHEWFGSNGLSWNYPAWSISAEWTAYLAFPVIAAVALHRRMSIGAALVLIAAALAAFVLFALEHPHPDALVRIAFEFTIGVLLFVLHRSRWLARLRWDVIGLASVAGAAVLASWLAHHGTSATAALPVFAVLIYALSWEGPDGRLPRWSPLRSRIATYWGRVSYSLYMTHAITDMVLVRMVRDDSLAAAPVIARVALTLGYLTAIAAIAMATYHWVEEPCRKWMRRRTPRLT